MIIYCDGSYRDGMGAAGIVLVNEEVIVNRIGILTFAEGSTDVEIKALEISLVWAVTHNVKCIYSDSKTVVDNCRKNKALEPYLNVYAGKVRWIERGYNTLSNGIARLTLDSYPWESDIEMSLLLYEQGKVIKTKNPMTWTVENEVVSIKKGKFHCTCKQYNYLRGNDFACKHIRAVKYKLNIANEFGEGII